MKKTIKLIKGTAITFEIDEQFTTLSSVDKVKDGFKRLFQVYTPQDIISQMKGALYEENEIHASKRAFLPTLWDDSIIRIDLSGWADYYEPQVCFACSALVQDYSGFYRFRWYMDIDENGTLNMHDNDPILYEMRTFKEDQDQSIRVIPNYEKKRA